MEVDPDYAGFETNGDEDLQEKRARIIEENVRDATVEKIQAIVDEQFSKEIEAKENELMTINKRLADARCVMDRLRACVVASYYATSFTKPVDGAKGPDPGAAYHPAIQNVMRKAVTSVLSKNSPLYQQQASSGNEDQGFVKLPEEKAQSAEKLDNATPIEDGEEKIADTDSTVPLDVSMAEEKHPDEGAQNRSTAVEQEMPPTNLGSRQRIKKTVVVGNVSKYIPPEQREGSDKSTHKWMVYVRGAKDEPRIDHFVRKVWFFLHPSYRPNDLVEVCEAPFHLTRRGWGEFPIRVQLHFCDRRNRPVDIIHQLRLDRSYTGLQTLGAETVCVVEIDESTVQLSVDAMLDAAGVSAMPTEEVKFPDVKFTELAEKIYQTPADEPKDTNALIAQESEITASSGTPSAEVHYAAQNQFQPVTTSCTISSNTVSPPRKSTMPAVVKTEAGEKDEINSEEVKGEKMDVDQSHSEGAASEKKSETEQRAKEDEGESKETKVEEEVEEKSLSPRRRRKRRRDGSRVSASEGEQDQTAENKVKSSKCDPDSTPLTASNVIGTASAAISGNQSPEVSNKASVHSSSTKEDATILGSEPDNSETSANVTLMHEDARLPSKQKGDEKTKVHTTSGESTGMMSQAGKASPSTSNNNVVLASSPGGKTQSRSSPQQKVLILGGAKGIDLQPMAPPSKSRQPIVLLQNSPMAAKGPTRPRSASDGAGVPRASCVSLIRAGLNVTPVLNVKVSPDVAAAKANPANSTGSPLRKIVPCPGVQKYIVLDSGSLHRGGVGATGGSGQVVSPATESVSLPTSDSLKPTCSKLSVQPQATLKIEPSPAVTKPADPRLPSVTIPLSSLLKTGSLSVQALAGKKPQSLLLTQSPQGPYITLKASGLPKSKDPNSRQKRSFSADQSPKHTVSLVPIDISELRRKSQEASSNQPAPAIQVQIVGPTGVRNLKSGTKPSQSSSTTPTLSLQALQAVLSSGGQQLAASKLERKLSENTVKSVKTVELAGQQQYVLATLVNPQGKQQLALINPSTLSLGSAKKVTPPVSKVKRLQSVSGKQAGQPKVSMKSLKGLTGDRKPSQEEAIAILNKLMPDPTYKVIGDSVLVENLTSIVDDALPLVVKRVPLVSADRTLAEFPFAALSEVDFLDWNVGKQRAAEWQRAILVRRVLKYLQNKNEKLQACKLPSKKFIMTWCLRHGFSVFTDEYEEQEGEQGVASAERLPVSLTLSSANELLKKLQTSLEKKIRQGKTSAAEETDLEVDVVTLDSLPRKGPSIKQEPTDDLDLTAGNDNILDVSEESAAKIEAYRNSTEVRAVAEMTRKLGFDFSTTSGSPICHMVLAKALKQLVDRITRTSLANALKRRDGETSVQRVAPDRIEVADVIRTLRETPSLDFTTDQNIAEGSLTAATSTLKS